MIPLRNTIKAFAHAAKTGMSGPVKPHQQMSFNPDGEDLVLASLVNKACGNIKTIADNYFFVDVGAFHPISTSVSYKFYRAGWRGINIEPNTDVYPEFARLRPEDTNLAIAIGETARPVTYYRFESQGLAPSLNTISEDRLQFLSTKGRFPCQSATVPMQTLGGVLRSNAPKHKEFGFLKVDVEGLKLEVLRSNDWGGFSPHFVLVEELGEYGGYLPIRQFLFSRGYGIAARTLRTTIYSNEMFWLE